MCSHLAGGGKVKPPFLVLDILYSGFQMYQEVTFSELIFEVVAFYVSFPRPLLPFNCSVLFHGQPEWSKAEHINQGLRFDAELDAISVAM